MNILIADSYVINRIGLKVLISRQLADATIDETTDCASTFEKVNKNRYELIIFDIQIAGADPIDFLVQIKATQPTAKVLVFSAFEEEVYAKKCMRSGANGYLLKTASETQIQEAISCVACGKQYLSPQMLVAFIEDSNRNRPANPFDQLSSREFQIALHLLRGESLGSICKTLTLRNSTVCTHKTRIFDKLKSSNIIQLHDLAKVYKVI